MKLRYRAVVLLAVLTLLMIPVAAAYAHECANAAKKAGAGSAGDVVVTLNIDGSVDVDTSNAKVSPSGRLVGGFADVTIQLEDGTVLADGETYAQLELPDTAQNAGPGDDLCDGVGVDNLVCP